jgi:A/G-specific adenine glycosylase
VWLSEIMLQQTQVATVIPYYQRFVASFPTITVLAAATEEQVLTHWSGLGYYARGRNLHKTAQIIVEKFDCEFPRKFEHLIELPGIGRSTAAAICALAYHERRAILDGNVKRVLARYCGIEGWAGEKKVEAQLWEQAEHLLPLPVFTPCPEGATTHSTSLARDTNQDAGYLPEGGGTLVEGDSNIAIYTQALMDMGANVCTRSKPKCALCPVQEDCVALAMDRVDELPAPRPRKAVPERHAIMLLLMHGNDILLEKRASVGIWGGLWSLPQFDDEASAQRWFAQSGMDASDGERLGTFTHKFTHFRLHISPLRVRLAGKTLKVAQPGSMWLDVEEALGAAIPTPVRKILERCG